MKRIRQLLLTVMLCLTLSVPTSVPIIGTSETVMAAAGLNYDALTLLSGQKKKLSVSGMPGEITWSSSEPSVVSVTDKGIITARKKGSSVITAKTKETVYTCKVTVQTPKLSCKSKTLIKGARYRLKVAGTNQKITWKSSNKKVAAVSSNGTVTARKTGKCNIYAVVLGKKLTCRITVTAPSPQSGTGNSTGTKSGTSGTQQAQVTYVWLSATGTKYHRIPNCGRMNPNTARKVTLSQAQASYGPCSKCF